MNSERARGKKAERIQKLIVTAVILIIIIVLLIIFVPKLVKKLEGDEQQTSVTTYTAEEITSGSIDTTITGSGTLKAVKSETLSAPYSEKESTAATTDMPADSTANATVVTVSETYTVSEINVSAGDEFSEGDTLAVLKDEDGNETKFTAEYDGIALEVDVEADDEISSGGAVCIIMSKDGFEISLSVDETDISSVEKGQEASVTVDALSDTYDGEISAISYNGSSTGSSTAYSVTVKINYEDGMYPAMNADAKIVTESSGEGLLVPVDAVNTSGDDSYVYIAPSSAESGKEYSQDELDLSTLEKVTVETGETDGTNIIIESDS